MLLCMFALLQAVGLVSAESFTIQISPETGTCLRGGSSVVTSGWFSTWKSTAAPQITIQPANGSTTNNMTVANGGLTLAEGGATSFSYSVSAPNGYVITSMSARIASAESTPTVSFAGKSVQTTSSAQLVSSAGLASQSVLVNLSSTASNAKATLTEWTVSVEKGEISTEPRITCSTEGDEHWYYIYSSSTKDYCKGRVWYYDSQNNLMKWGEKSFNADRIWSFWKNAQGKLAIKNYDGIYVGKAGANNGGSSQFGKASSESAAYIYDITYFNDGQFVISDGGVELHAQQNGNVLVRWPASDSDASCWNFEEVDASNPDASIAATTVQQGKVTTAIGNKNCAILRSTMTVSGLTGGLTFNGVKGRILADNLKDVKAVRAYFASDARELFVDTDQTTKWRKENGTLFAEGTIAEDGTYTVSGEKTLAPGTYYLWIAIDIADDAKEGNTVDATITDYIIYDAETGSAKDIAEKAGNPQYKATIFLTESTVLMSGDGKFGSTYFRIPAITTTADGKRLVTLTDDRLHHGGDLPNHVYITAQHSDDNGRTWSEPKIVAGEAATGGEYAHGDAEIITNRINGDIIGIMTCATNGHGFWDSTPEKPQTWKTIISHDGGETWSKPVDHTKELYGAGSPNPLWKGGFSGSGAGLQKRDGTLVSPFVNRDENGARQFAFFMSKDGGKSWYVSGVCPIGSADEPKCLERNNGDLAISVRASGYNYSNNTSNDGLTWNKPAGTKFGSDAISGNACDGEYMVWCSTLDGNPWNIALQTLPAASDGSRSNVSIALSSDEGETFFNKKTICPRGSAYSATTVLGDGTLGCYYEEKGVYGDYTMRFVRFSLDWASDGKYKFTEENPFHPIQTNIKVTTPAYGVQTLCLPYEQPVPEGMDVYECSEETVSFTEEGTERTATVLQPYEGATLQAFHPYVFIAAPESEFQFGRPLSEWKAQTLPTNCESKAGPLCGWYVNKRLVGDGTSVYGNPRNIASRGGIVFNRVTNGSRLAIPAYAANYVISAADGAETPAAVRILTPEEYATGVTGVRESGAVEKAFYHLNGTLRQKGERGIFVTDGKTVIVQ